MNNAYAKFVITYRFHGAHVNGHLELNMQSTLRHTDAMVHVRSCVRSMTWYRCHGAHKNVCSTHFMLHM